MAKLSEKDPVTTTIEDTDILYIVQDMGGTPVGRYMTVAQFKTELDVYSKSETEALAKKWALILG